MSVKACVKPRLTLDHSDEDEPLVTRRARLNQLRVDFKSSSSLLRPHKKLEKPGSDVQRQKDQSSSSLKENPIQSSKALVSETQKSSPPSSEDSENGMTSSSSPGCKDSDDGMLLSSSDIEESKGTVPPDVHNDRSSDVSSDDEPLIFRRAKTRYLRSDLEEPPSLVRPDKPSGKLCHEVQTLSYRDSSSLKLEMGQLLRETQKLPLASSKPYLSPPSSRLPLLKLPLVNGVSAANHERKKVSSILVKGENCMSHKEDRSNGEPDDSDRDMPLRSGGDDDSDDDTMDIPLNRSDSEESEDDLLFGGFSSDQSSGASDDDEPLIFRKIKLNRLVSDLKKSSSSIRPYTQLGELVAKIQNDQGFSALKGEDVLSQKSSLSKPASGTQKSSPSFSSVQTVSPSSTKPSPSLPSSVASHLKYRMANAVSSSNHKAEKDTTMPVKKDHLHDESENSQYDTSLSASDSKNFDDDTPLNTIDVENSEDCDLAAELHQDGVFASENETKHALLALAKWTSADTSCYQSPVKKAKLSPAFPSAKVQQNPLEANAKDDGDLLRVAKQKDNAESAKEGEKTLALPVDVDSSYHGGSIPLSEHKGKLAAASVREPLLMCSHQRKQDKTSLDATSAQAHEKHNRRLTELQFSRSSDDGSDSYGSQGRKHLSIESQRDIGKVSADLMKKGESNGFGEEDSMCSFSYDVTQIYRRKTAALIDDAASEKYRKELEKEKNENKQLKQRLNHAQKELLRINRAVQTVIDQLNLPFLTCKLTSGAHNDDDDDDDDDRNDNSDEGDDNDDDDSVDENGGDDDDE